MRLAEQLPGVVVQCKGNGDNSDDQLDQVVIQELEHGRTDDHTQNCRRQQNDQFPR